MPWEERDRRLSGVPRSGATGKWYSGITPLLLWAEAAEKGWEAGVWHTANSVDATVDDDSVKMGRSWLYAADRLNLYWPRTPSDPVAASERTDDLTNFIGVTIRPGRKPDYAHSTGVIYLPAAEDFDDPADRAATALELLIRWTRDERRLDRDDDDLEPLVSALGGALLSAALRVPGVSAIDVDWKAALEDDAESLLAAVPLAEQAVEYVLNLAHPALRAELQALDEDGTVERPPAAGGRIEEIPNLGTALMVDERDLRDDLDDDDDDIRTETLILAEAAGAPLHEFLTHFAHGEPEGRRKNPPLCAFLAGGPGTGRNQLVAALNALFRTGGTDLAGTLVATEGEENLLTQIEKVWSDERLMVLPAVLPPRVKVRHDRALPTACLRAFHIRYGLSPILWVARLEHRLLRSGEYKEFVEAFEQATSRRWRGDAHRNPDAHKEAMIRALGGADKGARRRVRHYERTRRTASWEALQDEAEWSLFHLRPGELEPNKKAFPDALERRVLFVLDLASALESDDPVARGWLRRVMSPVPAKMKDAARPAHRPFWYLMCPDISIKELADIVRWESKTRRKQVSVDLEQNPVTAAVGTDLLGKHPEACGPIYQVYANYADDLHRMIEIDGMSLPKYADRDSLLATFPFLPCVMPVAQAVLDTFAGDREALPLKSLVRRALDEQYYAPPDRFVPLDLLLEPMVKLLAQSTASATAGVRIFVGAPAAAAATASPSFRRLAFPHETVLQTVRWVNRIRGFPVTPENLVPLMLMRMDRPFDEMVSEVEETLQELVDRANLKVVSTPQKLKWDRGL